jgi:putative sterol carrier protein
MGGIEQVDPSAVQAEEFSRSIGETPDAELHEGMRGPLRDQVIAEVFQRMEQHFKADGGEEAVIHWAIAGRPDGGVDRWEVVIADRGCTASAELRSDPRVTLNLDGVDFLKLVTGNVSGPTLFMSGKLRIEGDLMFSTRIQSMFTIPAR